jgi:hypothetical protein
MEHLESLCAYCMKQIQGKIYYKDTFALEVEYDLAKQLAKHWKEEHPENDFCIYVKRIAHEKSTLIGIDIDQESPHKHRLLTAVAKTV